jgi:hypothetical protein
MGEGFLKTAAQLAEFNPYHDEEGKVTRAGHGQASGAPDLQGYE